MAQSLCVYSDGPQMPKSHLYHLYLNICISIIIILHAYTPKRQKRPTYDPKPLCMFRQTPKASHLISSVSLYSSHIIYITVSEGEGYCLMIFQTTFNTHVHKHIITYEISFYFHLTYFKSTLFSLKVLPCIYSKTIIKSSIKFIFNNDKYQHVE